MKIKIINIFLLSLLLFPLTVASQTNQSSKIKRDSQLKRLARQYEATGNYRESLQLYQRLWAENIQNVAYYRGVKNNLLKLKKYPEAIQAVQKMLSNRNDYYIKADLGEVYYQFNEKEMAFQIWNDILNSNKMNPAAYQTVANSMIANRLIDEAIETYLKGRENISNKDFFVIDLANLYYAKIDYVNATAMYLEYLKYNPKKLSYVEAQLTRLAKNIEESEPIIKIIEDRLQVETEKLLLKKLLASMYIQFSNYELAFREYKYIDENEKRESPKHKEKWGKELFKFAQNALQDGAFEYSAQAFQLVINRYPESSYMPRSLLGLAQAAHFQKNYDEATIIYKKIINQYPNNEVTVKSYFQIGEIYLKVYSKPDSAKEIFKKIVANNAFHEDHFEAMFKIGECDIHLNSLEDARKWYKKVRNSNQSADEIKANASYKLALIDFWQGKFDEAQKNLAVVTQIPVLRTDSKGFFVNDALELSIFIDEYKHENESLIKYAHSLLLIEQHVVPNHHCL